jgi:hypothetical protein
MCVLQHTSAYVSTRQHTCSAAYVCPDATHAAPHMCVFNLLVLHLISVLVLAMQYLTYVSSYYDITDRRRKT